MSMKNRQGALKILTSMFQELLAPLIAILSSYNLLNGNVPAEINTPLKIIGDIGGKMKNEVHYLYLNVEKEFDLSLPSNSISQVREHAFRWKDYDFTLADALQQIKRLREAGLRLQDPKLDKILGEILFSSHEEFQRLLSHLEAIEQTDLTL